MAKTRKSKKHLTLSQKYNRGQIAISAGALFGASPALMYTTTRPPSSVMSNRRVLAVWAAAMGGAMLGTVGAAALAKKRYGLTKKEQGTLTNQKVSKQATKYRRKTTFAGGYMHGAINK